MSTIASTSPHRGGLHPAAPGRAAFAFIFVTVALDMLACGVMVPVLPKLLIQMSGGDAAGAASANGIFGFAWAAMQLLFSPLIGALSDRVGRRPVVLLSNFGLGVDYLVMALAPTLSWLFLGRMVSGITAATISTAGAYISDVTPAEERARKFGMLGAAFGLGFVAGPALGGLLAGVDLRLPFWVAAGLSLANALYGCFVLPESLPSERRARLDWRKANPFGALALLRSDRSLLVVSAVSFLSLLAGEAFPACFVLHADYRFGWSAPQIGLVLAFVGVVNSLVSALLVGPVVKRFGERRAALMGLSSGVAGFCVFAVASNGTRFVTLGVPLLALWALAAPALQATATRRVGSAAQGRLQGAFSSIRAVAGMTGALVFTQVFAAALRAGGGLHLPGAPYLVAASLLGSGVLVCLVVDRGSKGTAS